MSGQDEFDRHSRRYKQFKVRNTRRTSTPHRAPRISMLSIYADGLVPPPQQPPSTCTEVDTTYVSYIQWRHYLLVPNSARKFQVRGWDRAPFDSIISGHLNVKQPESAVKKNKKNNNCKHMQRNRKEKKYKIEEELNSRFIEPEDTEDAKEKEGKLKERLEQRNQKIFDVVMPLIKKSLKKFVISTVPGNNNNNNKSSTSGNFLNKLAKGLDYSWLKPLRTTKGNCDDKEKLICVLDDDLN